MRDWFPLFNSTQEQIKMLAFEYEYKFELMTPQQTYQLLGRKEGNVLFKDTFNTFY